MAFVESKLRSYELPMFVDMSRQSLGKYLYSCYISCWGKQIYTVQKYATTFAALRSTIAVWAKCWYAYNDNGYILPLNAV